MENKHSINIRLATCDYDKHVQMVMIMVINHKMNVLETQQIVYQKCVLFLLNQQKLRMEECTNESKKETKFRRETHHNDHIKRKCEQIMYRYV